MLFTTENYGKPISLQLQKYLTDWTSEADVIKISAKTQVSISTIQFVKRGKNNLTESNSKAILELMKVAVKNCTNKIRYATEVVENINNLKR